MFRQFFKDKTILVTGIAGVKGTWLGLELLEAGSQVVGVDIRYPTNSNFVASGLSSRIRFVQGDITDLDLMCELLPNVDGVFHLAAVPLVGEAHRNPLEAYRTNILGTATVLDAIRLTDTVRYAVFVTTDKVYRDKKGAPWVETDPLGATGPYAVSKACAEFVIADYKRTYFTTDTLRIGVGRAGNVIIGGDLYSSRRTNGWGRLFVDCCEALTENRSPEVFRPNFTRPYTYGLDVIVGYMTLMSRLDEEGVAGEPFNFGPQELRGIANSVLATKVCELWGDGPDWRTSVHRDEPFDEQSLSWQKSRERLEWRPAYSLEDGIRDALRWYRAWSELNSSKGDGALSNLVQQLIRDHREAAKAAGIWWAL